MTASAFSHVVSLNASFTNLFPAARSSRLALPLSTTTNNAWRSSGMNDCSDRRSTNLSLVGGTTVVPFSVKPALSCNRNDTHAGLSMLCFPAPRARANVNCASTFRADALAASVSRAAARLSTCVAIPLVTKVLLQVSSVTGSSTENTTPPLVSGCRRSRTEAMAAMLAGVKRSVTVLPGLAVSSTNMDSPPKVSW